MKENPALNHILSRLVHLFQHSPYEVSIIFEVDIAELLCSSSQDLDRFCKSPTQFLNDLMLFLRKGLANQFIEKDEMEKENLQLARRLECTHIFLQSIPYTKAIYKNFSDINSDYLNQWVIITGTVIQSMQKKTLDRSKLFECINCGAPYRVRTVYQNSYHFEMPPQCSKLVQKQKSNSFFAQLYSNFNKRKPKEKQKEDPELKLQKCGCTKFKPIEQNKICIDLQEIRIQEQFQYISSGRIPQVLTVIIEGDIIGPSAFRLGDDITITGILGYRYKKLQRDVKVSPQMVLIANHIAVEKSKFTNESDDRDETQSQSKMSKIYADFPINYYSEYNLTAKERIIIKQLEFRRQIVSSFSPSIYGRDLIKLGLILSLLGGVSLENESSQIRGHSHVLIIGEPGTGKSVLLKETATLADRSFFTNGIGTSSAGLSVSYFKEGKDWMVEAGALVLADNGICCIDELTLLTKKDEKSLLECMEQQTISSAKASVVGKFNARTTVIGACNPIRPGQKYDPDVDLQSNTGLSIPLLTRFDMIFIIKDEREISEDAEKCDHILSKFCTEGLVMPKQSFVKKENINLKSLIRKCKSFDPELTANQILTIYYTEERKKEERVKTARAFQSLCRIAEAHAKLMLREKTILLDYVTAIMITENNYFSTIEEYYAFLDDFNKKYGTDLS